ncbi:GNAT family N-acetyltransferase [Pseudonocardia sp. MH-G8]|uniref:GNAT family N-acetyltransferase n=1 Tax=Pseudonocardia sp. MH-G8 TaxID=1854588 RepID=UPI000BA162E4|nr:GNAT family N-acetyltransferase [Pseudonocardia sp. MH-G8]OZM79476.1 GNAT family N-acetyltransferase [Pseudonocardia sp. MH-G8]
MPEQTSEQTTDATVEVSDAPHHSRFEITAGGRLAGFLEYRMLPGVIVFEHTEINQDFQGRGLAGQLAAGALDAVRDRDLRIRPVCEYLAGYVQRNPRYAGLVEPPSPDS